MLGETLEIEVRFSEPVTVTGAPRLTLTLGSDQRHAAYAWSRQQVVRFRYVVQEGDSGALGVAADGLSLNGGTIVDAGGNAAVLGLGSTDLALGFDASGVRRDEEPPTVSSVLFESLPANGAVYERGESVQVAVRFSEPVTVTGMPQLALAVGSATRAAAFDSSEQEYVRFRYRVQEQDHDGDGIGVAAEGITPNGGTIVDGADNPAELSLAAAAIGSGHPVDGGETTDTVPTRAAVTSEPRSGGTYGRGESVDVEVEFNKEVTVERPAAAGADDRLGYGSGRGPRRPPGRGPGRHRPRRQRASPPSSPAPTNGSASATWCRRKIVPTAAGSPSGPTRCGSTAPASPTPPARRWAPATCGWTTPRWSTATWWTAP